MRIPSLLALALLALACSSSTDSGGTTGGGGTSIGAAGGSVTSSDGKVQLVIPAGALSSNVSFTITPDTATTTAGGALVAGSVYDFEPSGTTFATPATIRIPYTVAGLPTGASPLFLAVFLRDGPAWDSIPSTLDTLAHTVSASVSHFSTYGLCSGPCLIPPTGFVRMNFYPGCCTVIPVGTQVVVTGAMEWNNSTATTSAALGTLPAGIIGSVTVGGQSSGCPSICYAPVRVTLTTALTTPPGRYDVLVNVTASGGTPVTGSATIPISVTAVPGFTLSAAPASLPLTGGGTAATTATITRTNFTTPVTLSATGLPTGVTVAFSPATLTGDTLSSALLFTATSAVPSGSSTVTIHASASGAPDQTTTVTLVVAPFSVAVVPTSGIVTTGGSSIFAVKVTRASGFATAVALSASGLPTGVTAAFATTSVADSSTMTLTAAGGAATGFYPVQVTGTAGSATQVASLSLQVAQSGSAYTLDFSSCLAQPIWVAFQDGGNPWTAVTGSSGVYRFPTPASQQVGVAFVESTGSGYSTVVQYLSPAELSQLGAAAAPGTLCAPSFPGFQSYNGVAQGTDSVAGKFGFISMGGGGGATRSDGPYTISVPAGNSPPFDVTGYLEQAELHISSDDSILINRNVSGPGLINFDAGKPVATSSAAIQGGVAGDYYSVNMYYATRACQQDELYVLGFPTATFQITGMPASLQIAGDLHVLTIGDLHTSDGRNVSAMFHTMTATTTVALGATLSPTVTSVASPYKRLSLSMPSLPGDYTTLFLQGTQGSAFTQSVSATRSYLGGGAVSLTMPDFSNVAGFSTAWEPAGSTTLTTRVSASSSAITGSQCGDGVMNKSVYVTGSN
ncbi:MAG TPA: hypothetical protein VGM77_04340 [Gemmatimonadales bacterium]|jgi:hypothetical protein